MRRRSIAPRENWRKIAEDNGFFFHHVNNSLYWNEYASYVFSLREIEDDLEDPANEINAICLELAREAARSEKIMDALGIPEPFRDAVAASINESPMYGRMDFSYDGNGPAKLLEYNADTPTSLYESAWFQWLWLEDMIKSGALPAGSDQFNSIHERLRSFFRKSGMKSLHLASMEGSEEDRATVEYIMECAAQEGIQCAQLYMEDIGLASNGDFVGLENEKIESLFKLYPWEFIWKDKFGVDLIKSGVRVIEPAWKMILSNKGILPLLWQRHKGHPNLLPAWFESEKPLAANFARKPMLGREGANVSLHRDGGILSSPGEYGNGRFIYQELQPLPNFAGNYPVMGVWIADGEACGLGVREDNSPVTGDLSRFVPHYIE